MQSHNNGGTSARQRGCKLRIVEVQVQSHNNGGASARQRGCKLRIVEVQVHHITMEGRVSDRGGASSG